MLKDAPTLVPPTAQWKASSPLQDKRRIKLSVRCQPLLVTIIDDQFNQVPATAIRAQPATAHSYCSLIPSAPVLLVLQLMRCQWLR